MNELLKLTIDAHGGLSRWKQLKTITARLACDGALWALKGQEGVMDNIQVTVDLEKQWVSHYPFIDPDWHTIFETDRVAIQNENGETLQQLSFPRVSFDGHTTETTWTRLQLIYFIGYAMWTYFNAPFVFASEGFQVSEIEPWEEDGEVWRRLKVKFPDHLATHSSTQIFYIGADGLIRRHDYDVDILEGAPAAHYCYDYTEVEGIKIATKRLVFARLQDNTPSKPGPVLVAINISEVKFNQFRSVSIRSAWNGHQ